MAYQNFYLEMQIGGGGTATATLPTPINGLLGDVRISVLQANKATPSVNTVTITIQEVGLITSTLFTKAGVTGANNRFAPEIEIVTTTGTATGLYRMFTLSGRVTISGASGTSTDWVLVQINFLN